MNPVEAVQESMDLRRPCWVGFVFALISLVCHPWNARAGDIVHDDDLAPKKPGCENDFVLVKAFSDTQLPISYFRDLSSRSCLIFIFCLIIGFFNGLVVLKNQKYYFANYKIYQISFILSYLELILLRPNANGDGELIVVFFLQNPLIDFIRFIC